MLAETINGSESKKLKRSYSLIAGAILLSACTQTESQQEAELVTDAPIAEAPTYDVPTLSVADAERFRQNHLIEMIEFSGVPEQENLILQSGPFQSKTIDIPFENLAELEYKFRMKEGTTLMYSWEVLGDTPNGGVYSDFHGHPGIIDKDKYPERFVATYNTGAKRRDSGVLQTKFTGYHGWYFFNLEARPLTVRLTVSGYFEDHLLPWRSIAGQTVHKIEY